MNALQQLPKNAHVVIIRLRSLGDSILTTPALEILKQTRPDLRVAVVVETRFAPVFQGNSDVTEILPPQISAVVRWKAELCVNLHGGTRSMMLTRASRARIRAGFAHFRGPGIYNCRIPTAQEVLGVDRKVHTAEHLASAMFFLGADRNPIPRAKLFAPKLIPERPYAVIHPIAASEEKTWRADGFLAVAQHLESRMGLEPVFIAGPGEDLRAFNQYRCVAGAPLEETKSLVQSAAFFVGNDSGPAHMAAAFGIPVVVVFGNSDPVVWAPWKVSSHVVEGGDAIKSVEAAQVIAAVDDVRLAASGGSR